LISQGLGWGCVLRGCGALKSYVAHFFCFCRYFDSMLGLDAAANKTRTATKMITFSASQKFRHTFCFLFFYIFFKTSSTAATTAAAMVL